MIGGEDFPTAVPVCTRVRYADNIHNAYVFRAELSQKGTRNPHRYHMLPGAGSSFSLIFIPAATTGGDDCAICLPRRELDELRRLRSVAGVLVGW